MCRMALFGLAMIILAGCATTGVERVSQIRPGTTVTPLSLMGDVLAIRHVGTTVFQNESRDLDVAAWAIDKSAEAAAVRLMRNGGKLAVVTVETDNARRQAGKLGTNFWTSGATLQGGPESIIILARQAGADYVLVMGPVQLGDPFFGTNQAFSGYGIYQRSAFGSKRAINYLTMRVVLFDGLSGEEVARTHGHFSSPRGDADWMASESLQPDGANAANTKSTVERLIETALQKSLTDLRLRE